MRISEGQYVLGLGTIFIFWLFLGLPWLNSPAERIQYYENHKNSPTPSSAKPEGTSQSPFFVQVMRAPKSAEERTKEAEDREEKKSADRWLVRWTAALFAATVGLILATGVLGFFSWRQTRDMAKSIAAAERSAESAEKAITSAETQARILNRAYLWPGFGHWDRQIPGILMHITVYNSGGTAGIIKAVHYAMVGEDDYKAGKLAPLKKFDGRENVIPPNMSWMDAFSTGVTQRVESGHFISYGYIVYRDVFEQEQTAGWLHRIYHNGKSDSLPGAFDPVDRTKYQHEPEK